MNIVLAQLRDIEVLGFFVKSIDHPGSDKISILLSYLGTSKNLWLLSLWFLLFILRSFLRLYQRLRRILLGIMWSLALFLREYFFYLGNMTVNNFLKLYRLGDVKSRILKNLTDLVRELFSKNVH